MQWKEQSGWWMVKDGNNKMAEVVRSSFCGLQSYCDALVDDGEGKVFRVMISLRRAEDGGYEVMR